MIGGGGKYRTVIVVKDEGSLRRSIHYRGLGKEVKEYKFETR